MLATVQRLHPRVVTVICCCAVVICIGCSENVYLGTEEENLPPTVRVTNGPLEGQPTLYQVHFYWLGYDPDGTVERYEYVITSGDPIGFNPADTTGLDKWTSTTLCDMVFTVSADANDSTVTINQNLYTRYSRTHTLFIRAVDDGGLRSEVEHRSFTAFTLAPHIFIEEPYMTNPGSELQYLGPVIHFCWSGKDPLDTPWNYQEVDSVRYLHTRHRGDIIERLNLYPEDYEADWSPWISYDAPGDSGKATILGDDETMELNHAYVFAVQAKDEAGAVSAIFDARTNVRCFIVMEPTGPLLTVHEKYLGVSKFLGTKTPPKTVHVPGGLPVQFNWSGDASHYGGTVSTYRYGWDIKDLNDPGNWDVDANPFHTSTPEKRFYSGIHSLFIEAVDNIGTKTIGKIEVNVVPLVMDRSLLWVDDFYSSDFVQAIYMMPTESEHDAFWLDICSRADKFDPDIDVYDTQENFFKVPDIQRIWRYKNVIWTYGSARWDLNTWMQIMEFNVETDLGGAEYVYNILSYYHRFGGHLWTTGRSDQEGGLGAALPRKTYYRDMNSKLLVFPLYLKCEMMTGPGYGCQDTTGVLSFPYHNYCVSMLDRAYGVFRSDEGMPTRKIEYDALQHAVKDTNDPITASHPGLPETIDLWDTVTLPGMFFDPKVRGFHYVEIYNPSYWMRRNGFSSQSCFHPMYRLRTLNTRSAIDNAVIAFWITKYADVKPEAPGTVAAASVHFGIPLWYFNRDDVHEIADAIFEEWNILREDLRQ